MEKKFGVVSADGHCRLFHLPFDLWTKRLPRRFQDDAPRGHGCCCTEVEAEGSSDRTKVVRARRQLG